jgi:hypothetical protein
MACDACGRGSRARAFRSVQRYLGRGSRPGDPEKPQVRIGLMRKRITWPGDQAERTCDARKRRLDTNQYAPGWLMKRDGPIPVGPHWRGPRSLPSVATGTAPLILIDVEAASSRGLLNIGKPQTRRPRRCSVGIWSSLASTGKVDARSHRSYFQHQNRRMRPPNGATRSLSDFQTGGHP